MRRVREEEPKAKSKRRRGRGSPEEAGRWRPGLAGRGRAHGGLAAGGAAGHKRHAAAAHTNTRHPARRRALRRHGTARQARRAGAAGCAQHPARVGETVRKGRESLAGKEGRVGRGDVCCESLLESHACGGGRLRARTPPAGVPRSRSSFTMNRISELQRRLTVGHRTADGAHPEVEQRSPAAPNDGARPQARGQSTRRLRETAGCCRDNSARRGCSGGTGCGCG